MVLQFVYSANQMKRSVLLSTQFFVSCGVRFLTLLSEALCLLNLQVQAFTLASVAQNKTNNNTFIRDAKSEEHEELVDCPTQLALISHLWIFIFVSISVQILKLQI